MITATLDNFRIYIDGKPVFYAKGPEYSPEMGTNNFRIRGFDLMLFPRAQRGTVSPKNKVWHIYFENEGRVTRVFAKWVKINLCRIVYEPERMAREYDFTFELIESAIIGTPETV